MKKIYFYKEDGSPITETIKTIYGEYKEYHNYELHEGEYVEGDLVLMRRIRSFYETAK